MTKTRRIEITIETHEVTRTRTRATSPGGSQVQDLAAGPANERIDAKHNGESSSKEISDLSNAGFAEK